MNVRLRAMGLGLTLSFVPFPLHGAPQPYRELLPRAAETEVRVTINDLLRASKHELNSCIGIGNIKTKTYVSGVNLVEARSTSIVHRVRKDAAGPAEILLETGASDRNLIGTCLQKALGMVFAADVLQGEPLDGRVVSDVNCNLDVDRHKFSLDEIDFRCHATWRYFRLGDVYRETSTKTWK